MYLCHTAYTCTWKYFGVNGFWKKWLYITVEIKLQLQYEPENLDVSKVCFAK